MTSSTYPSRYSNGKLVTAAQYITELICEKKAKLDKTELPQKFWELKVWNTYYRQQIVAANKLLKEYSGEAIAKALKSEKAWNIFSLRAPHLKDIIVAEEEKLKKRDIVPPKATERRSTKIKTRPSLPSKTHQQLRKLDE
jgi:lantibiotic modifying enzyme